MRHVIAALAFFAFCGVGCELEEPIVPVSVVESIETENYAVALDVTGRSITLSGENGELARIDLDALALGVVDEVSDATSYDPWQLVAAQGGYFPPAGTAFHPAGRVLDVERRGSSIEARLEHTGGLTSRLVIASEGEGRFRFELVPENAERVVWIRLGAEAPEGEAYYGLGELFDRVDQRGAMRAMQLEVAELESANNEAHVPVPLLIGTRGWGLFVESSHPGVFDVAASDAQRISVTYGLGGDAKQGLVFHLLAAEHPLDVTRRYYELTGFPKLPAPWALGPLVWRDENDDQAQVEADLDSMRDLDLATTGIWIDRPYATGVNTFDFDAPRFPDPVGMVQRARALGFRVALWHVPYLDDDDASTLELRTIVEESGFYPVETGIKLNGWGKPIDFTVPAARTFWQTQLAKYIELGIEGFKLDYGEDIVPGVFGARNVYRFHDGSDERTMHRGYTLLYHQTYSELMARDGGFLLCRAGKWGDQKHGCVIWPGDLDARMWRHGELVTEDGETFRAVGGLEASIVAGLTLGPSGFPFYGSDTGGYRHSPPDKETFTRWFQQTAFSSVMQIGTSSNDVAWELFADDPSGLDAYRRYTRWHLRMFPYLWSFANEIATTGRPIQRALGLAIPELGRHDTIEYLLGDALLVAPVTSPGVTSHDVVMPSGTWIELFSGARFEGPATHAVDATELPVFLREGEIVPLLRPTIDTLSPTTEPDRVDSFATNAGPLWVLVGGTSGDDTFEVYDGTRVVLQGGEGEGEQRFEITPGSVFNQGAMIEVIAAGSFAPSSVRVGAITLDDAGSVEALESVGQGFVFAESERGGTLWIKLPPGAHDVGVVWSL